jgi:Tfp pilus assembly protein PilF
MFNLSKICYKIYYKELIKLILYSAIIVLAITYAPFASSRECIPDKFGHKIIVDKNNMIQEINKIIKLAAAEINKNNWISANYHLKNAIDVLGFHYVCTNIIDDSEMHLVLAHIFETKGKLEQAANMRMEILKGRLDQFKIKPYYTQ